MSQDVRHVTPEVGEEFTGLEEVGALEHMLF